MKKILMRKMKFKMIKNQKIAWIIWKKNGVK